MIATILMILGGIAWLTGELWAAFKKHNGTTSDFIWSVEARWPVLKVLIGIFVLSLFGHFMFGWTLLP